MHRHLASDTDAQLLANPCRQTRGTEDQIKQPANDNREHWREEQRGDEIRSKRGEVYAVRERAGVLKWRNTSNCRDQVPSIDVDRLDLAYIDVGRRSAAKHESNQKYLKFGRAGAWIK